MKCNFLSHNFLLRFTFFLVSILLTFHCVSQNPVYKKYTVDDGLSSNEIYQITQDSKGYIWLATSKGASRFDGSRFENFSIENGLPDNEVLMVTEDKRGRIWFKSFTGPMAYYDGTIHNSSNTPWLKQLEFKHFAIAFTPLYNGDVLIYANEKVIYVLKDTTLQIYKEERCTNIFEKRDSSVLIAQDNNLIDNGKNINAKILNIVEHGKYITYYNKLQDVLLIVADSGMYGYKNQKINYLGNQKPISNKKGGVIISDNEGYFWNTDIAHLFRFKIDENAMLTDVHSYFDGISITNIFQDKDNNFWFASKGEGLLMVPSLNIRLFNKAAGLQDNNITAALRMKDDGIICGTMNGFVNTIGTNNAVEKPVNTNFGEIRKIIQGGDNSAYILSFNKLLYKQGIEIKNLYTSISVTKSIARFCNGDVIIGGYNHFVRYSNGKLKQVNLKADKYWRIYSVCERTINDIWIGTEKGLYNYKNNLLVDFHHEIKSFNGWIDDISKTRNGTMLVTTRDNGLAIIKGDDIKFINTTNGLQSNVCASLYYDSVSQKIFLGLNTGLSVISFDKDNVREIKNYNPANGLLCGSINSISENNGEILLSTDHGLLVFNEKELHIVAEAPRVYITLLEINNKNVELKPDYTLAYDENNIRIMYGGISFRDAKSIEYRYRLFPVDKEWNYAKSRTVIYPELSPGAYQFIVQVRTGNGKWFYNNSSFRFTINKPYWATWWFRILIIIFIITLIYIAYRFQLKRELKQLLAIAEDRKRISAEMHDDLGSGLSKISLLSDMINRNNSGEDMKPHLETISRSSREMVEKMGDIIWSMNVKNDELSNLIAYSRKYAMEFFETTPIRCIVILPESVPLIHIDGKVRRNIFLVVKEALHNVLKHSGADNATLQFDISSHSLSITISDNGKGIDPMKLSEFGNGLGNMEKRMKDIGGTFYIKNNGGTHIEISIPV